MHLYLAFTHDFEYSVRQIQVYLTALYFRHGRKSRSFVAADMKPHPQPYWLRLRFHGISHGLKSVHRTLFLTAFRFPYGKKRHTPKGVYLFCEAIDVNSERLSCSLFWFPSTSLRDASESQGNLPRINAYPCFKFTSAYSHKGCNRKQMESPPT